MLTVSSEPGEMCSLKQEPEIVPPILVDEHGDVEAYGSVQAVLKQVESIDVLNNEYVFYDSTGRVLEARVHKGKVSLVATSTVDTNPTEVRRDIIVVLRALGVPEEGLSEMPFPKLSALLFGSFHAESRNRKSKLR